MIFTTVCGLQNNNIDTFRKQISKINNYSMGFMLGSGIGAAEPYDVLIDYVSKSEKVHQGDTSIMHDSNPNKFVIIIGDNLPSGYDDAHDMDDYARLYDGIKLLVDNGVKVLNVNTNAYMELINLAERSNSTFYKLNKANEISTKLIEYFTNEC